MINRWPFFLLCICVPGASQTGPVRLVPAGDLIQAKANLFDLSNRTVRLTPHGAKRYAINVQSLLSDPQYGTELMEKDALVPKSTYSWKVNLPFPFRFGDKDWTTVFVNIGGNMTFGRPESDLWPERDPWADGSMQAIVASIDSRTAAGQELMIAPFWCVAAGPYYGNKVFVKQSASDVLVTWNVSRLPWAYLPLGTDVFQARLRSDGSIEFSYVSMSERDGIVGLFPGRADDGVRLLDMAPGSNVADAVTGIDSVKVYDHGSTIRFNFAMRGSVLR